MSTKFNWRGGLATWYDGSTQERVLPVAPVVFYDDFIGPGATVVPAAGAAESGAAWVKKIVGAGPPTVAQVADTANGIVACTLEASDQKQDGAIYLGDERNFCITQGTVFEARIKVSVLPTGNGEAVWGLAGDWVDGPDAITYSVWFTADGGGEIYCEKDDASTDQTVTSGITVVDTAWHIYRIDFTSVSDIKFYIDGAAVATGTTFGYVATGANATLQPYFAVYKASGTGAGTIQIDYCRVWQNRA